MCAEIASEEPLVDELSSCFPSVPRAYAHLSSRLLRRTLLFFSLLGSAWCRRYVLPWLRPSWGRLPVVTSYIKRVLFRYFCGGESRSACGSVVERLWQRGLYSALDYAAEDARTEKAFTAHSQEIEAVIKDAVQVEAIAFAVMKPSALGDAFLMSKKAVGEVLSVDEQVALLAFEKRLQSLCQLAYELRCPLLIDAEEYAAQGYVDELVTKMSAQYNRSWVCVYNTYQMYRKDSYDRLQQAHKEAQQTSYLLGAKLVRGAYMEKERQMAEAARKPSPIHEHKTACDADYNRALCYVLDNVETCALFAGTHNVESCALLRKEVERRGLQKHPHVWASQLYGMGEALSYGLQRAGVRVAKYIPYGPYLQLLPYLHRRVLENSALQGQSSREIRALRQELQRRRSTKGHSRK